MVAAVVALQDVQETALPLVAEGAATDVILLVAEDALPVVEAALAAPAALETVLDNVLVGATPTALAAQATARGTVPSRVLTLAPPLVMVLAQSA